MYCDISNGPSVHFLYLELHMTAAANKRFQQSCAVMSLKWHVAAEASYWLQLSCAILNTGSARKDCKYRGDTAVSCSAGMKVSRKVSMDFLFL